MTHPNIDETLKERGSRYGEFDEHARVTQNIKAAIADSRRWADLDDDMRECLEMIAHKIGRIVNGDPTYIDSWTDLIGYPRLVEKRLINEQKAAKVFTFPTSDAAALDKKAPQGQQKKATTAEVCSCSLCLLEEALVARIDILKRTA